MSYRIIKVEYREEGWAPETIHIEDTETGEVMTINKPRIWEDDQQLLEEMFLAVKNG